MTTESDLPTLLVPVANTETAERLMDTAIDIATDRSLQILVVHVVAVPPQVPLSEGDRLQSDEDEAALEYAAGLGEEADIPTTQRTRYARDVGTGIVGGITEYDADTVLMGWRGRPPRRGVILGSFIDKVLRAGECDVLVKRIKTPTADIDSILLPVASGPHSEYAAVMAGSLARCLDASVHLVHVVPADAPPAKRTEGEALLEALANEVGEAPEIEQNLSESDHVAGYLTDRSSEYDATIVGASEKHVIRQTFMGTVSEAVGRHAAGTVFIAQRQL